MTGRDGFTFDDHGALAQLATDMAAAGMRAGVQVYDVTRRFGVVLHGKVKAKAKGRPGPRVQTGDYNRSIGLRVGRDGQSVVASVGTNRPQGRRLEFGFKGFDSLGRYYDQRPLPHFGPAFDEVAADYEAAIAAIAAEALERDRKDRK